METGKNPGLNVRALHERGITGKGVGIAVIDQNLLAGHEQYAGRLRLYELYRTANRTAVMHSAVASIAAGKDTGVAPGADLYYIATMWGAFLPPFSLINYKNAVTCIDRILEINTNLPENEKIRVISISKFIGKNELGAAALNRAIDRANDGGVFIVTCSPENNFDFKLRGLGRDPEADPDSITSYSTSILNSDSIYDAGSLLVPIDSRTAAGYSGEADYIFYRRGGLSWSAPWLAGLYALCVQVRPDITPELFIV
jgi:subtilisin family serine protease